MKIYKLLAPILILCLFAGKVAAQVNERESLRGITAVNVAVAVDSAARGGGLTEDRLKTTAELGLRRNGIQVGTSMDWLTSTLPWLTVTVSAVKSPLASGDLVYAAYIEVSLRGAVTVDVSDLKTYAYTWKRGILNMRMEDVFELHQVEVLEELVDEFSNDYLAVNPK